MIKTYLLISILISQNANITFSGRQFNSWDDCKKFENDTEMCYEIEIPALNGKELFNKRIELELLDVKN